MRRAILGLVVLATVTFVLLSLEGGKSHSPAPVAASPGGTVTRVSPVSQTVPPGETFTVDITVEDVTDLGAYEWQLEFDPAVVGVVGFVDVVNGPFLGSSGRVVMCQDPVVEVASVRLICSTFGAAAGPAGSGVLSTVTLSAGLAPGTRPLDLIFVRLSDTVLQDIATEVFDGSVSIGLDSDEDGLLDSTEIFIGTDPDDSDTDDDLLTDGEEVIIYGTDPLDPDSDDDTLSDFEEVNDYYTDPVNSDSESDGMPDPYEVARDCLSATLDDSALDPDEDDLANIVEHDGGTEPCDDDTDGDGLSDGEEVLTYSTCPADNADPTELPQCEGVANAKDTDGDRLSDYHEVFTSRTCPANNADPTELPQCQGVADATDTDGDGLSDGDEVLTYRTFPLKPDTDGDGLSDGEEVLTYGTCPVKTSPTLPQCEGVADARDTDGDGLSDGDEVFTYGTCPADNANPTELPQCEGVADATDTDGDGMPDDYEVGKTCLDPLTDDSALDPDADGLTNIVEHGLGTNPCGVDTDGDGFSDQEETDIYGTDPTRADTDGDGLSDYDEVLSYGTCPVKTSPTLPQCEGVADAKDTDGDDMPDKYEVDTTCVEATVADGAVDFDSDGLSNVVEFGLVTDPCVDDTDEDGLSDGDEVLTYSTCPANNANLAALPQCMFVADARDTDGDTLSDSGEVNVYGTDPLKPDTDGDGLSDYDEVFTYGTCPADNANPTELPQCEGVADATDTDGDGMPDDYEVDPDRDCLSATLDDSALDPDEDGLANIVEHDEGTEPCNPDTDGDGLSDQEELDTYPTDPLDPDTDGDGLSDGDEVNVWATDPLEGDTDGDGLTDGDEVNVYSSDPLDTDTDDDLLTDGLEVALGLSPISGDSDGDGVPDVFEDADSDGVSNGDELFILGTDPGVFDTDGDGCSDGDELPGAPAPRPGSTGTYDPLAWHDVYDVPVPANPDPDPNGGWPGYGSAEVDTYKEMGDTEVHAQRAQGFKATGAASVLSVYLWLKKVGTPTDDLTVEIQTEGSPGLPSGTVVPGATSNAVSGVNLGTSPAWVRFTFPTPAQLSGTASAYHLVLGRSGEPHWANYYAWGADTSVPAYGGRASVYNGFAWVSEEFDHAFFLLSPRNQAVTIGDLLAVLFYVGTSDGGSPNANGVAYDTMKGSCGVDGDTVADKEGLCYDRSPSAEPNPPWEAGPPDGAVTMQDVLAALAQVGLSCLRPP